MDLIVKDYYASRQLAMRGQAAVRALQAAIAPWPSATGSRVPTWAAPYMCRIRIPCHTLNTLLLQHLPV